MAHMTIFLAPLLHVIKIHVAHYIYEKPMQLCQF